MAQLHGNGWSNGRDNNNRITPVGAWARTKSEENEIPRNPIEFRGSSYLAFCKVWAPLWIDEDEAGE